MDVQHQVGQGLAGCVGIVDPLLHAERVFGVVKADIHCVGCALKNRHGCDGGSSWRASRGRYYLCHMIPALIHRENGQRQKGHNRQDQQGIGGNCGAVSRACLRDGDGRHPFRLGVGTALRLAILIHHLVPVEPQEEGVVAQETPGVQLAAKDIERPLFQCFQVAARNLGGFGDLVDRQLFFLTRGPQPLSNRFFHSLNNGSMPSPDSDEPISPRARPPPMTYLQRAAHIIPGFSPLDNEGRGKGQG
jgi:hypothetical protein